MPRKTRGKDADEVLQSLHGHELAHQEFVHQVELVAKDENTRRLRVREEFFKDDIGTLRSQMSKQDTHISELAVQLANARADADSARGACRSQEKQIKNQAREIARLKTEFESLNGVSQESSKLLAEKLALGHEINTMKPELEHLRSKLAHHQTMISEKLALERQLMAAEVDLAAEKRARQQATDRELEARAAEQETQRKLEQAEKKLDIEKRDKEQLQIEMKSNTTVSESESGIQKAAEQELRQQLKDSEAKLASEKRGNARVRKESEAAVSEAEARTELLQQRLDSVKSKLRTTQGELRTCRTNLERAQQTTIAMPDTMTRLEDTKGQASKKRRANEVSASETTLATLEDDEYNQESRRLAKKRVADQSLVGEKSTFSITPFLNRNKPLGMDAVLEEGEDENEADVSHVPKHASSTGCAQVTTNPSKNVIEDATPGPAQPTKTQSTAKECAKKAGKARGRPKKALAEASPNMPAAVAPVTDRTKSPLKPAAAGKEIVDLGTVDVAEPVESAPGDIKRASVQRSQTSRAKISNIRNENTSINLAIREPEVKRKKRKLVGDSSRTIFDDDAEGGEAKSKQSTKVHLGSNRTIGKQKPGGVRNAFAGASFSPLKKDRRGVHASFLA